MFKREDDDEDIAPEEEEDCEDQEEDDEDGAEQKPSDNVVPAVDVEDLGSNEGEKKLEAGEDEAQVYTVNDANLQDKELEYQDGEEKERRSILKLDGHPAKSQAPCNESTV